MLASRSQPVASERGNIMADIQFPNVLFGPGAFNVSVLDNNGSPASVLDAGLPFTIHAEDDRSAGGAARRRVGRWRHMSSRSAQAASSRWARPRRCP